MKTTEHGIEESRDVEDADHPQFMAGDRVDEHPGALKTGSCMNPLPSPRMYQGVYGVINVYKDKPDPGVNQPAPSIVCQY